MGEFIKITIALQCRPRYPYITNVHLPEKNSIDILPYGINLRGEVFGKYNISLFNATDLLLKEGVKRANSFIDNFNFTIPGAHETTYTVESALNMMVESNLAPHEEFDC